MRKLHFRHNDVRFRDTVHAQRKELLHSKLYASILEIHDRLTKEKVEHLSQPLEMEDLKPHLAVVGSGLDLTLQEAWIFGVMFARGLDNGGSQMAFQVQESVGASGRLAVDIGLVMLDMHKKGILQCSKLLNGPTRHFGEMNYVRNLGYVIPESVINHILVGHTLKEDEVKDGFDILTMFKDLSNRVRDWSPTKMTLFERVEDLLLRSAGIPLADELNGSGLDTESKMVMLTFLNAIVDEKKVSAGELAVRCYFDHKERMKLKARLISGAGDLFKSGYLKLKYDEFTETNDLALGDKGSLLLQAVDENLKGLLPKEELHWDTVRPTAPTDIEKVQLFFRDGIRQRYNELKTLSSTAHFKQVRQRMLEKGLRGGLNILLSGSPGTGKTELVRQLARENNCMLVYVDLASIKGRYVGDSETAVKQIFSEYSELKKRESRVPILLLNEADGLLSKRQDRMEENFAVLNMLNTMQNILLQEMEDFDGILIATTNRPTGFDKAFERRFLYRFEVPRPDVDVQKQIWKHHFSSLSEMELNELSGSDMTGSDIANVARVAFQREILFGTEPSFSELLKICSEARSDQRRKQIGFNSSAA